MTTYTMPSKEDEELKEAIRMLVNQTRKEYAYPEAMPSDEYEDALKSRIRKLVKAHDQALLDRVEKEIIGADESPGYHWGKYANRDRLRADQRKALQAIIKEIEAPNQSGEGGR
jgi:hypothetical protein